MFLVRNAKKNVSSVLTKENEFCIVKEHHI